MSEHAIANAKAWLETICGLYPALAGKDPDKSDEDARQEAEEMALSVRVRDGWRNVGEASGGPEEFEILLSTGGPALRLHGAVDPYGDLDDIKLQWQDWGTPWTRYAPDGGFTNKQLDALHAFANCFYLGES